MIRYISKDAVVAEIERRIERISNASTNFALGRKMELANILSFLNTLEVKEVVLEKEFDKCCENYTFDDECEVYTAKHFFELGLKAQSKDMIEALRTEYEKGRADVIADTLSWLENCWPKYCYNHTIIDAYKEGVVKD